MNVARDIGLEYIVLNKQVEDNRGVGAEYLPDIETYLREQLEAVPEHVEQLYENDSFVLYRVDDTAPPDREVLLFDTSWQDYLDAVFTRLDLSRCYDFQYISDYEGSPTSRRRCWRPTSEAPPSTSGRASTRASSSHRARRSSRSTPTSSPAATTCRRCSGCSSSSPTPSGTAPR